MFNMMKDILQYVPYALFLAVVFAVLFASVGYTYSHFRKSDKRASAAASKLKN